MDEAAEVAVSLKCPSCQSSLASNPAGPSVTNHIYHASQQAVVLTRYHSEGGVQEDYDILPDLTEEAYLISHPETRPARAFLMMCAEGDVQGMLGVLSGAEEDEDEDSMKASDILRYQDPLGGMKSGLHIAIEKGQEQVFYLLLWLGSSLKQEAFPQDILQSAQQIGLMRPEVDQTNDIRQLQDEKGETAETYASRGGFAALAEAGVFQM